MPKLMQAVLSVPSGSRPSGMLTWLNKILEPHRMSVSEVTDIAALDEATRGVPQKVDPGYEAAWREMHGKLNWMQGHPGLNRYLGFNFADIANKLIDAAYPGLRAGGKAAIRTDTWTPIERIDEAETCFIWARRNDRGGWGVGIGYRTVSNTCRTENSQPLPKDVVCWKNIGPSPDGN